MARPVNPILFHAMSFQVIIQPSKHQFPVEPGQTVLDAALAAGIVLPQLPQRRLLHLQRQGGVREFDAGQYPAQILSPEELADGYTLFCQARPESDLVVESTEVRLASDIQIRSCPRACRRWSAPRPTSPCSSCSCLPPSSSAITRASTSRSS